MNWYALEMNKTGDGSLDVFILDEIGGFGISASEFIRDVNANSTEDQELRVHINSPGGDVFQGLAIYNFLKARGNVTTINEGIAASMASVIFMAGSNRISPENAFLMIHNPWGVRVGNADELREAADGLEKIGASLSGIYVKATGLDAGVVEEMMRAETLMNGVEALEKGFATMTTEAVEIAASFDIGKLGNKIPESIAMDKANKESKMEELKKVQDELIEATAKLEALEKDYEAKAKVSFDDGVAQGEDQGLGKVKARMDRYKDSKFVVETIDLTDNEVKDKYIEKLEADNKLKDDALAKLDTDTGHEVVETLDNDQSDPEKVAAKASGSVEEVKAARLKELLADNKTKEEAYRIIDAEMPKKETE